MLVRLCYCERVGRCIWEIEARVDRFLLAFLYNDYLYLALYRCRSWNRIWAEYCEMPGADPGPLNDLAWLCGLFEVLEWGVAG